MNQKHSARGAWLIVIASVIALAICIYDYCSPQTGLVGTGGVVLVAIAAVLMLLAALALKFYAARPRWLQLVLAVAILLDIIGSGVAGYFLESPVIMAAMVLALIGWLMQVIGDAADRSVEVDNVED